MKINPPINTLRGAADSPATPERVPGKGQSPAAPSSGGTGSDRVALSPLSAQIAALGVEAGAEPGFDRARVDAIKQAIVEGRLGIDPNIVADKMIASALAMIERGGNR